MAERRATERTCESQAGEQAVGGGPFKRWTAKRKAAVVLDLIRGRTPAGRPAPS